MPARSRLLIAVTPMGFAHAKRALHRRFDLVPAFSLEQALAALDAGGIDAIVCSIHFDDSRMFDLLHLARSRHSGLPFICCRLLHSPLSSRGLDAMVTTARELGCRGFVDFNELQRSLGVAEADRRLCEALAGFLEPSDLKRSTGA